MPTAPLQPCSHQPCAALVQWGTCPAHRKAKHVQIDQRRGTSTERGYTPAWRVLRVRALERDAFQCVQCGYQPDIARLAKAMGQPIPTVATLRVLTALQQAGERHLHVDHIESIEDRPDLRLDLSNLRTLCDACHNARTARDQGWGRG